ncbi:hypothetical protein PMAYCL1PPCAC_03023, partial [Pristionchus mayeri]
AESIQTLPECVTKFFCYAFLSTGIDRISVGKRDIDEFEAMVKIHAYNEKRFYVVAKSFKDGITSIELSMKNHIFTCELKSMEGGKKNGVLTAFT